MLHIKLNESSRMQQHGNKYFVRRPLPPLPTFGVGSMGRNLAFSEYDH